MEKVDLDEIESYLRKDKWLTLKEIDSLIYELKSLRSENEKLRKVAEASEQYVNDKYLGTGIIEDALKEWKGE